MFERLLLESGKYLARSRVSSVGADVVDESRVIAIPVFIPEGVAVIVNVYAPSNFMPGVAFGIGTVVRNDGYDDDLFIRITNVDTGEVLGEYVLFVPSGASDGRIVDITLVQETDFNGLIEVGHVEGTVVTS